MTTWVFSKVHADAVRRDPNETELFKTEQSGEGEYSGTDALVRETIKNCLDANHGSEPDTIRFDLYPHSNLRANQRPSTYCLPGTSTLISRNRIRSNCSPKSKHRVHGLRRFRGQQSARYHLPCQSFRQRFRDRTSRLRLLLHSKNPQKNSGAIHIQLLYEDKFQCSGFAHRKVKAFDSAPDRQANIESLKDVEYGNTNG